MKRSTDHVAITLGFLMPIVGACAVVWTVYATPRPKLQFARGILDANGNPVVMSKRQDRFNEPLKGRALASGYDGRRD
jgi:hypothetical protein